MKKFYWLTVGAAALLLTGAGCTVKPAAKMSAPASNPVTPPAAAVIPEIQVKN